METTKTVAGRCFPIANLFGWYRQYLTHNGKLIMLRSALPLTATSQQSILFFRPISLLIFSQVIGIPIKVSFWNGIVKPSGKNGLLSAMGRVVKQWAHNHLTMDRMSTIGLNIDKETKHAASFYRVSPLNMFMKLFIQIPQRCTVQRLLMKEKHFNCKLSCCPISTQVTSITFFGSIYLSCLGCG